MIVSSCARELFVEKVMNISLVKSHCQFISLPISSELNYITEPSIEVFTWHLGSHNGVPKQ